MIDAKHEIRTYLLLRAPLRALVGGRIFPGASPQGSAKPLVEIELDGDDRPQHMGGTVGSVEASFTINVYDFDEAGARRVAMAIREAMSGIQRNLAELVVDHARLDTQTDDQIPPSDGSDQPLYNIEQDWTIWYRESVPAFPAS